MPRLMTALDSPETHIFSKRSRFLFEKVRNPSDMRDYRALVLNEAFCAEKDVSSTSRYRLHKDGEDMGVYKSSGLIVSTGTGSTAWLYAARQITPPMLADIKRVLGEPNYSDSVNEEHAHVLSD